MSPPSPAGPLPRLLAGVHRDGRAMTWDEHVRYHGPLPRDVAGDRPDPRLIEVVERSGLLGRGGASFPAGRKMAAVAAAWSPRRPALVVVNGAEDVPPELIRAARRAVSACPTLALLLRKERP